MFDFIWNLASFIVAIGVLITFHEYGHFWVARKCGVKVERFSIGFGKAIWRKTDSLGTEYVIAAIPLGGYVKMLDERVDDVAPEDKDKTFNCKSVYQRIAIIAAGPIANFLLAIVAFFFVFIIGSPVVKPIIGAIKENSPAFVAELPKDHQIIQIGNYETSTWQDVNMAITASVGEKNIELQTKRLDSQFVYKHQLNLENWNFSPEKESSITSLGITPYRPDGTCIIAQVQSSSPAAKAGLKVGDEFIALNGVPLNKVCDDFTSLIQKQLDSEVLLTVVRDSNQVSIPVQLVTKEVNGSNVGYLGIGRQLAPWPEDMRYHVAYGMGESLVKGIEKTWDISVFSLKMIGKLITGDVSVKSLSGPIGIAQGAGVSAGFGIVAFLGFLALFSINLGIFNLLPLPILDGGHLLYYLIELLTGKPVPESVQEVGFKIGAFALLGLMALAIFNDISRL